MSPRLGVSRVNSGYFAPTYGQIRDIFYPTIEEVAHDWGLAAKINESNKEVHLFAGRKYRGTVICRSMEKPGDIVGFKIGKGLIDELDVMKTDKAALAWRKIIARLRHTAPGLINGVDVTTTPEGSSSSTSSSSSRCASGPIWLPCTAWCKPAPTRTVRTCRKTTSRRCGRAIRRS